MKALGGTLFNRPHRPFPPPLWDIITPAFTPTNDGLTLIVMAWPRDQFHAIRVDIEKNYMETIDLVPGLAERVREGHREERFYGTADLPNFFRKPYGQG